MKTRLWIAIVVIVIVGISLTSMVLLNDTEADQEDAIVENPSSQVASNIVVADWCSEHSVPESECTQCNPSLIDQYKASGDWCVGHDLPESCRLCNPEIEFPQEQSISSANTGHNEANSLETEQTRGQFDWCIEHSVPESECTQCNPALIDQYKASDDWCAGHSLPESHCRLCNPEIEFPQEEILKTRNLESIGNNIEVSLFFRSNKNVCATNDALIQFASSKTADRSGITVQRAFAAPYEVELEAPAEILFDENNTVVISSSVKVLVSRWLISPGDVVTKGDPIAISF